MKRVDSGLIDFTEEDGKKIYNVSRSRLMGLVNWVHVFWLYLPWLLYSVVFIFAVQIFRVLYSLRFDLQVIPTNNDDVP